MASHAQQEVKIAKAEWDKDQWENERTEAQGEQDEELNELTKDMPRYNKLLIAIPVMVVVMVFIIIICIFVVYQRISSKGGKERISVGFPPPPVLWHCRCSSGYELEEGSFQRR